MRDIALPLQDLLRSMNADAADAFAVRKVHDAFAQSVIETYGLSAAKLVLKHVQGVSIVKDDGPYKAGVKPPCILHVYADDSTIVSDLDARQHVLCMCLRKRGVHADSFKLYFSRFGMKERAPFADYFDREDQRLREASAQNDQREDAFEQAGDEDMVKRLQVLKTALCLVFGEAAEDVVYQVNAAYVRPCGKGSSNVSLYVQAEGVLAALRAAEERVCAAMRDLGVPVRMYTVAAAEPWMVGYRAFPSMSAPVVVKR